MRLDETGQLILEEEEKLAYRGGAGNRLFRLLEAAFKGRALDAQGSLVTFNGSDLTPFEAGRLIGQYQARASMFHEITDDLADASKESPEEDGEGKVEGNEDDMGSLM